MFAKNANKSFSGLPQAIEFITGLENIYSIRNTCNSRITTPGATMSVDIGGRLSFVRARHKLSSANSPSAPA